MRIDQDARDADGEMEAIADETDLERSQAAAVNRPPVGTHAVEGDDLLADEDFDVDLDREYPATDD
jgi:phosphomethylpyrimidine synthase